MGKIINNSYIPSEDELDALAAKNANAKVRLDLLQRAEAIQARIDKAIRINKREDKRLPRYYDYNFNGSLRNRR